jgi:hypothetical protein
MGAENAIELPIRVSGETIEVSAGPHNEATVLGRWGNAATAVRGTSGDARVIAYFRSEEAKLLPGEADAAPHVRSDAIVLSGRVTGVSYPGGRWRHAVRIGARDFQVDAAVRYAPSEQVRILLPAEALYLFPGNEAEAVARAMGVRN